jgi:hypothetical protein
MALSAKAIRLEVRLRRQIREADSLDAGGSGGAQEGAQTAFDTELDTYQALLKIAPRRAEAVVQSVVMRNLRRARWEAMNERMRNGGI